MDRKQETIDTYNRGAATLAAEFNSLGARVADIEKAFSIVSKANPKVVELGCGNGRDAKEILKRTTDYTGIDISEELLKEAQKNNPDGNFQLSDLESYNFPQGTDIIFAFASLLHSNREVVAEVLRKAGQSLSVNGVFYISLKYGDYHEETKTEDIGSRTFYFYTPEELMKITPAELVNVYEDVQELRGQKWFTLALQKSA